MSHGKLPTLKIDDGKGSFVLINECDFDPKKQTEFKEKPAKKARGKAVK